MSEKHMKVAKDLLEFFNRRDWDRYREALLPNAVYIERATGRRVEGSDNLLRAFDLWTTAFPDLRGTITNLVYQNDTVVAEVRWDGTHQGLLKGPFGEIPATGREGKVDAVEIYTFKGDKVAELRHYFDLMTVLNQIQVPAIAAV